MATNHFQSKKVLEIAHCPTCGYEGTPQDVYYCATRGIEPLLEMGTVLPIQGFYRILPEITNPVTIILNQTRFNKHEREYHAIQMTLRPASFSFQDNLLAYKKLVEAVDELKQLPNKKDLSIQKGQLVGVLRRERENHQLLEGLSESNISIDYLINKLHLIGYAELVKMKEQILARSHWRKYGN